MQYCMLLKLRSTLVITYMTVSDILIAATTGSVNISAIDKLEADLNKAQMEIQDSGLNQKYMELAERHSSQQKMMKGFTDDLEQLMKDVENIRAIEKSIPTSCYSEEKLEPTPPATFF